MSDGKSEDKGIWWVLTQIKEDLARIDTKWDENLESLTKVTENLRHVTDQVTHLNRMLTVDNGKPSVVTQLRDAAQERMIIKALVTEMKADLETVKKQTGYKLPSEIRVERIKTISKLVGLAALVTPGLLSFIHFLSSP